MKLGVLGILIAGIVMVGPADAQQRSQRPEVKLPCRSDEGRVTPQLQRMPRHR